MIFFSVGIPDVADDVLYDFIKLNKVNMERRSSAV